MIIAIFLGIVLVYGIFLIIDSRKMKTHKSYIDMLKEELGEEGYNKRVEGSNEIRRNIQRRRLEEIDKKMKNK